MIYIYIVKKNEYIHIQSLYISKGCLGYSLVRGLFGKNNHPTTIPPKHHKPISKTQETPNELHGILVGFVGF